MSERIPVLLVVHRLNVGGAERDLAKLARFLDPKRFEVHVAAFHVEGERRAELDQARIPVLALPVRSFRNTTAITGARVLRSYIRRHRIEVIQAFDTPTSIYCTPLGRAFGVKAVLSSHLYFRHLITGYQYAALRMVDWLSHRIVVNAQAIAEHLERDYGVPANRVFVSHNGVETSVFYPRQDAREQLWAEAGVVIGTLCVQREEKRVDVLIDAFASLRQRGAAGSQGARLLIVGDGPMHDAWKQRASSKGLDDVCRFVRTSGDVPRWLRQMDVYALPSRSEGFPNSVLEAMACGVPTVASRVGGIPEMVVDGESGLLFDAGSAGGLAQALEKLVADPDLRRRMGLSAAERAKNVFSMEVAAKRMGEFYEGLVRPA